MFGSSKACVLYVSSKMEADGYKPGDKFNLVKACKYTIRGVASRKFTKL